MPWSLTGREAVCADEPCEGTTAMAYDPITPGWIGVDPVAGPRTPNGPGTPTGPRTPTGPYVPPGAAPGTPPIASGAGGRLALAGASRERRLPARRGPAPEVPPRPHVSTRGPERPTQCRARPGPGTWWDEDMARSAAHPPATGTQEQDQLYALHERHVSTRRRPLRRSSRS